MDDTYSADFLSAVYALRALPPAWRALAHDAADCWSNDELVGHALRFLLDNEIRGELQ